MTIPYIPGWGDTVARNAAGFVGAFERLKNPYILREQELAELITQDPSMKDKFADMAKRNPDQFKQLYGERALRLYSSANVSPEFTATRQVKTNEATMSNINVELGNLKLNDLRRRGEIDNTLYEQFKGKIDDPNFKHVLNFAAERNWLGTTSQEVEGTNLGITGAKTANKKSELDYDMLQDSWKASTAAKAFVQQAGNDPVSLARRVLDGDSPEELAQHMAAIGTSPWGEGWLMLYNTSIQAELQRRNQAAQNTMRQYEATREERLLMSELNRARNTYNSLMNTMRSTLNPTRDRNKRMTPAELEAVANQVNQQLDVMRSAAGSVNSFADMLGERGEALRVTHPSARAFVDTEGKWWQRKQHAITFKDELGRPLDDEFKPLEPKGSEESGGSKGSKGSTTESVPTDFPMDDAVRAFLRDGDAFLLRRKFPPHIEAEIRRRARGQ